MLLTGAFGCEAIQVILIARRLKSNLKSKGRLASARRRSREVISEGIFSVIFLFVVLPAQAANRYVDGSLVSNCTSGNYSIASRNCSGSDGNAYQTINGGMAAAVAGDSVHVRSGLYDEAASAVNSGTSSSPITIQSYSDETPNLVNSRTNSDAGVINLVNVDHWIVKNLKCDASALPTTSKYCIRNAATSRSTVGNRIENNTIIAWGGTDQGGPNADGKQVTGTAAIISAGTQRTAFYATATITRNTITNAKQAGIRSAHERHTVISNNVITGTKCGLHRAGSYPESAGIKLAQDSIEVTVTGNSVGDNQSGTDCNSALPQRENQKNMVLSGIYCDTGASNGTITKNNVYNIQRGSFNTTTNIGIWLESRCKDWVVSFNTIRSIGYAGIRLSAGSCANNSGNKVEQNSITDAAVYGIWLRTARAATIRNNDAAIANSGRAAINIEPSSIMCGDHTIYENRLLRGGASVPAKKRRNGDRELSR